jgi:hypothetical protein
MNEYEIKFEPVTKDGVEHPKYNIYYYIDGVEECKEFHSTDGVSGTIREGYTLKTN